MTIQSKSISYSQRKNRVKRGIKDEIMKQISRLEEGSTDNNDHYNYLKRKLNEIEEQEIE